MKKHLIAIGFQVLFFCVPARARTVDPLIKRCFALTFDYL